MVNVVRLLVFFVLFILPSVALPAEIVSFAGPDNWSGTSKDGCTFTITGEINQGDRDRLKAALGEVRGGKGSSLVGCLNSEGGNFDEGIKLGEFFLEALVATRILPREKCLSACAVMFMAGQSLSTDGYTLDRRMANTAVLGFHAPFTQLTAGTFDSADLQTSFDEAIDSVGRRLLRFARHFDRNWSNPLIKPGLINEMMLSESFYYIDTVGKASEWEIAVDTPAVEPSTTSDYRNVCKNAAAAIVNSSVAAWIFEMDIEELVQTAEGATFRFSQRHNIHCRAGPIPVGIWVVLGTGVWSGDRTITVSRSAIFPPSTPLDKLTDPEIRTLRNQFPRPSWCEKPGNRTEKIVCSTAEFSAADLRMESLYRRALQHPGDKTAETIKGEQREWVKQRNACSDYLCLNNHYNDRSRNLEIAVGK